MTPAELVPIIAASSLAAAIVTTLGLVIQTLIVKRLRSPADENERTKLGNEFLRGLLDDARKEREELRKSISELKEGKKADEQTIARLEQIAASKDSRIVELEDRIDRIALKLHAGQTITLADVLGGEAPSLALDHTVIP